jgi:SAM-dependent methyltransferase
MKSKQKPTIHPRQTFLEWYQVTTLGQILQTIEAAYLQSSLKLTYNQKTLQVGFLGSETLYIAEDFSREFVLVDIPPEQHATPAALVTAAPEALPIAGDSVDILILPHVLEFVADRHQILREAERVLKPEGRLFILGLNPWSLHGILQSLPRHSSFRRGRCVSSSRVLGWLNLLKFEADLHAAFSLSSSRILGKPDTLWSKARAQLSFAYALKAIKRRYTLIPIEPAWMTMPSLANGHMFEIARNDRE